jgi:FlaA1/EpsC-like NDP-sugar epimerase
MNKTQVSDSLLHYAVRIIVTLPRSTKRLVMLLADAVALPTCLASAVWLVTPGVFATLPLWVWMIPLVLGVSLLGVGGFYRSVVRFMGLELVEAALKTLTLVALVLLLGIGWIDTWPDAARASAAFWLLGVVYVVGSRLLVRWLLQTRSAAGDRARSGPRPA